MEKGFKARIENAYSSCIESGCRYSPETGIILGSGLSGVRDSFDGVEIPFSKIKEFPFPGVKGHSGILKVSDKCAILAGRFHFYEGHSIDDVVLPVFLLFKLGIRKLIITNAAGGINSSFKPGDLVLITDHINLTGQNPLIGGNIDDLGPRFPDMSRIYSSDLITKALDINPELKRGVYAGLTGPTYETPAEIRMLKNAGADLVGMSTVNEVTAAAFLGMKVLGISCVTNMAAGISGKPLDHMEVIETGKKAEAGLSKLAARLIMEI